MVAVVALKEVQALKQGRGVSIPGRGSSMCWRCWVRREQGCYRNRERAGGSRGLERERRNQGQGLMDAFRAPRRALDLRGGREDPGRP